MKNNKRPLTITEKALLYLIVILIVLFVLIVSYDFARNSEEKPTEPEVKTESITTKEDEYEQWAENYQGEYPTIGDKFAMSTNVDDLFNVIIEVNGVVKSSTLDEAFDKDAEIRTIVSGYKSGKDASYYESELRYLYITLSVKNVGEGAAELSLSDFSLQNYYNGEMHKVITRTYAYEHISGETDENGIPKISRRTDVKLEQGQEKQFVLLYILPPCSVYDLYLSTHVDSQLERLVFLNISLGEIFLEETEDGQLGDYAKRKYKQHKIESGVLNYNLFREQIEGIPCLDRYLYDAGTAIEPYFYIIDPDDRRISYNSGLEILEASLYDDIDKLPEQFGASGYLESMLGVYMEQLPYEKDEYRFLFIEAELTQAAMSDYRGNLSECFWLYNRDDEGNLWYLGYPDDFYILRSSAGQRYATGSDYLNTEPYEVVSIMAAYVIVPDTIYDVYIMNDDDELKEGDTTYTDAEAEVHNGGISLNLKYYEEGGIKK